MTIDAGVPIPHRQRRSGWTDLIISMEIGHSTVIENQEKARSMQRSVSEKGYRVTLKTQSDGTVRVWRTQ